jgi:Zn-dependent peptidase ImmA (M78 family)
MPKAHPPYPYVEPIAADVSDLDIERIVADMLSQSPTIRLGEGGPLDPLCKALAVDVEYSDSPNEILLDVPARDRPVIWLPRKGQPRQDRLTTAIGIGHWMLHVLPTREARPGKGIQALHAPTDRAAREEARRFAHALLMPSADFIALWYRGRATLTADVMNVPTQAVYDRARSLLLTGEAAADAIDTV